MNRLKTLRATSALLALLAGARTVLADVSPAVVDRFTTAVKKAVATGDKKAIDDVIDSAMGKSSTSGFAGTLTKIDLAIGDGTRVSASDFWNGSLGNALYSALGSEMSDIMMKAANGTATASDLQTFQNLQQITSTYEDRQDTGLDPTSTVTPDPSATDPSPGTPTNQGPSPRTPQSPASGSDPSSAGPSRPSAGSAPSDSGSSGSAGGGSSGSPPLGGSGMAPGYTPGGPNLPLGGLPSPSATASDPSSAPAAATSGPSPTDASSPSASAPGTVASGGDPGTTGGTATSPAPAPPSDPGAASSSTGSADASSPGAASSGAASSATSSSGAASSGTTPPGPTSPSVVSPAPSVTPGPESATSAGASSPGASPLGGGNIIVGGMGGSPPPTSPPPGNDPVNGGNPAPSNPARPGTSTPTSTPTPPAEDTSIRGRLAILIKYNGPPPPPLIEGDPKSTERLGRLLARTKPEDALAQSLVRLEGKLLEWRRNAKPSGDELASVRGPDRKVKWERCEVWLVDDRHREAPRRYRLKIAAAELAKLAPAPGQAFELEGDLGKLEIPSELGRELKGQAFSCEVRRLVPLGKPRADDPDKDFDD